MPYPSRGEWTFNNLTRAFRYWPRLSTLSIKQENVTGLTTLDCEVPVTGANAGVIFGNEDHCEALFRGSPIWRGHIKGVHEGASEETGPAIYTLAGQDYTAKLDDAIIRRRQKRKRERLRRRVRWILSYLPGPKGNIWPLDGIDLSGLPDANPFVEKYDYYGASVREALEHVASEHRLVFYIDLDNVFHMLREQDLAAPFGLDNEAPDLSTTFPFRRWEHDSDSDQVANAVLVEPQHRKGSRWSKDAAAIAAYTRQERFISDQNLGGPQSALNVGERALAENAWPVEESQLLCWEPGLAPGQVVHVREAQWDHDFDRTVKATELRAPDAHDASGQAYLVTQVTLSGQHSTPGTPTTNAINKTTRTRPGITVDTGRHVLDTFDRIVTPPTISDGAAVAAITVAGYLFQGRYAGESQGPVVPPAFVDGGVARPGSWAGWWYNGHTSRPSWTSCGGLDNVFTGFKEYEMWYKLTVSGTPGDAAGVKVTFQTKFPGSWFGYHGPSYGEIAPIEIVASATKPTAFRQGTKIGEMPYNSVATLGVPMSAVPGDGEVLYLGYRTSWRCNAAEDVDNYVCGWTWPYMSQPSTKDDRGDWYAGFSGRTEVAIPTAAIWQEWDASEADLGTLVLDEEAPYQGGNAWHDAGFEGDGAAWSMDGTGLVLESDEPSGKGIYVDGSRNDDEDPGGAWSDAGWAHEIEFSVTAHGSTSDVGVRHIESTTTGQGEQAVGRVQLGDTNYDEGIYVAGPSASDYLAKALTLNELWVAKFDTRSGTYVRGKLWRKGDGEPALWDVQAQLAETDDELDRWMLWLRAGNDGTSHGVKVHETASYAGASSGQRIVKEYLGIADGLAVRFPVAHQYELNSLRLYVAGVSTAPYRQFPDEAEFTLDFAPTAGSIMRATYVAS